MQLAALVPLAACILSASASEPCTTCGQQPRISDDAGDDSSLLSRKVSIHAEHKDTQTSGMTIYSQAAACLRRTIPDADMALEEQMWEKSNEERWHLHNYRTQIYMQPAAVVFPRTVSEVSKATQCAIETGLQVKASSGRHSYMAYCNPCLLLNMYHMKEVNVDNKTDTGVLGAGLNLGQAYTWLADENYTIAGGTCPTVGLAGLALGGGKGILLREYGLLADRVYGIDAVLQNGSVVHANASQHEDLLWIAKGGGGDSFPGIVTAFHINLIKVPSIITEYSATWTNLWTAFKGGVDFSRGVEVFKLWQNQYASHPDWRVYVRITIYPYDNQLKMDFKFIGMTKEEAMLYAPKPNRDGARSDSDDWDPLAPDSSWWGEKTYLRSMQEGGGIGQNFTDQGCADWPEDYTAEEWEARARKEMLNEVPPFCTWDSGFTTDMLYRSLVMSTMSDEAVNNFISLVATAPYFDTANQQSWHFYLQIDPTNGFSGTVAPDATPYPHRSPTDMTMQVIAKWSDSDEKIAGKNPRGNPTLQAYNYLLIASLQPYVGTRAYYNYLDANMPGGALPADAYFGMNKDRVISIRERYVNPQLPLDVLKVNTYASWDRPSQINKMTLLPWELQPARTGITHSTQAIVDTSLTR